LHYSIKPVLGLDLLELFYVMQDASTLSDSPILMWAFSFLIGYVFRLNFNVAIVGTDKCSYEQLERSKFLVTFFFLSFFSLFLVCCLVLFVCFFVFSKGFYLLITVTMNLTIITPTTNYPHVWQNIMSVAQNGLYHNHWLVSDGYGESPYYIHSNSIILPENTGMENGKVRYFGHRVYSAMSFLVNTRWVMFLDEDNMLSEDFAEKITPFLAKQHSGIGAVTFRRKIFDEHGEFVCVDDFESVPTNGFADTGCVIWDARYYNHYIAPLAFKSNRHDFYMYRKLVFDCQEPPHLPEYLLHYTSPNRNIDFFRSKGQL
jgi:hypothetical protein